MVLAAGRSRRMGAVNKLLAVVDGAVPFKGETVEVRVLPHGFEYEGDVYRTLSAVAKKVTGTHWNGPGFFGLRKNSRNADS